MAKLGIFRFSSKRFADEHCEADETVIHSPRKGCWKPFLIVKADRQPARPYLIEACDDAA